MENKSRAQKRSQAVVDQLNAEIGASRYNVKSLAEAMGVDYYTFRRYTKGERELPMNVLWNAIDALGISEETFFRRVLDRFED